MPRCYECEEDKEIDEFYPSALKYDTYKPRRCKQCTRQLGKRWKEANPDKVKNSTLKSKYGITLDDKKSILEVQNNLCPGGCGRIPKNVDHNHTTGEIRGILCRSCNLILGHAKDNPEVLDKLAAYLRRVKGRGHI